MTTPNWQHHSKKEQKRRLKPQAMRARREALRQFKKRYMGCQTEVSGAILPEYSTHHHETHSKVHR